MHTGPVQYFVIAFGSDTMSDEVVDELVDLAKSGTVRLVDLVFLEKRERDGATFPELDRAEQIVAFAELDREYGGLIGEEDINIIAEEIDPGSSAALVVVEDLWAAPLAAAIERSGGKLLAGARIPKDLADAAITVLGAS
jgi:uncharacterized membrane protein